MGPRRTHTSILLHKITPCTRGSLYGGEDQCIFFIHSNILGRNTLIVSLLRGIRVFGCWVTANPLGFVKYFGDEDLITIVKFIGQKFFEVWFGLAKHPFLTSIMLAAAVAQLFLHNCALSTPPFSHKLFYFQTNVDRGGGAAGGLHLGRNLM